MSLFKFRVIHPTKPQQQQFKSSGSPVFDDFIATHKLQTAETTVLLLGLIPFLNPNFLFHAIKEIFDAIKDKPIIGGYRGKNHRGILPNAELALFLLAGEDLRNRIQFMHLFESDHLFSKKKILSISKQEELEPHYSKPYLISQEYFDLFVLGKRYSPSLSPKFPAQLLQTQLEWSDLVLGSNTATQIEEIKIWLDHNAELMKDSVLGKKIKSGYVALFYGPSGTGKTLTATLLGTYTGKDVYRIDLSQVISKYIGETEKNLSQLFEEAKDRDWILFFDEADSIFGKRTNVKDAHDKYANQEVSYLLQQVENHDGLVILASNFKGNIDTAFTRRFQSIIEFETPKASERLEIWKKAIPGSLPLEEAGSLTSIAQKYELNGANIINIVHYASLQSLHMKEKKLSTQHLMKGIKREFKKEGKIL
ncbi:ATP-binding protein [Mongoliitalea daihaiensis]|uniref:ATP-binding protein n=1 Tax=Mongoliitalea daihaiensis TaxID=2782006 RepID=UPI001F3A1DD8|nr:ATP-binding protein [Mongoliitalea daihaiensis]